MKLATHIRPLSHFKAHASKVVRQLGEEGAPMVITLNGEAKAVVQDVHGCEPTQETLALLRFSRSASSASPKAMLVPLDDAVAQVKARRRAASEGRSRPHRGCAW